MDTLQSKEDWKVVEGFSRYEVSNEGEVIDTKYNKMVAKQLTGIPQYYYVNMNRDDGKRKLVRLHRLVATAFVEGQGDGYDVVDHIDRNKLNNHYTNLRWTDSSGNQRNRDSNIFISGTPVMDYSQQYDNPEAAYNYLASCLISGMNEREAVDKYQEHLDHGLKRKKVIYLGEVHYLTDLSKLFNMDYELLRNKIVDGELSWNSVRCIPESFTHSFELLSKSVTGYWIPSKSYLESFLGKSLTTALGLLETYEDIVTYDSLDFKRVTVGGIKGTIKELCIHFKINEQTVAERVRKGWSLEKSLTEPYLKLKHVRIDGVCKSLKGWFEYYQLDYRKVSRYRDKTKSDFESTLKHFGVDTSGIEISYGK